MNFMFHLGIITSVRVPIALLLLFGHVTSRSCLVKMWTGQPATVLPSIFVKTNNNNVQVSMVTV